MQAIISEEEGAFSSMLSRGIKEFNARTAVLQAEGGTSMSGESAFFLYDSMGFPLDLTELMAREAGLSVDAAGFEAAMAAQKARSAAAAQAAKGSAVADLALGAEQTAWLADSGVAFTDDKDKFAWDVQPSATVRAIYSSEGGFVDSVDAAAGVVGVVLDQTAFFAQAGGQVPDAGSLLGDGVRFDVESVQSFGGYVLHVGALSEGALATGVALKCDVDYARRGLISNSHTLTHAMNLALHQVLGEGVSQKGSLVDEEKARFDFSHRKAMTPAEVADVEKRVQELVAASQPVHIETVPLDKALAINNLRAVFGERYPDPVRVVSIGPTIPELLADPGNAEWEQYSIELCGGTHIPSTDAMQSFALVEEAAVAKGVRRVVGLTGEAAAAALARGEELTSKLATLTADDATDIEAARGGLKALKVDIDTSTISAHVKAQLREAIGAQDKALTQKAKQAGQAKAGAAVAEALAAANEAKASGQRYVVLQLGAEVDGKAMQPLVQAVLKETGLATFAMAVDEGAGRVACVAAVSEADAGALAANSWLKEVLEKLDGRGGGKALMAQGSGTAVASVPEAVETASAMAAEALA